MSLEICEIFYSLQGESTHAGLPCIFIRLTGCNLDCTWCDTPYARTEAVSMGIDQIVEKLKEFNCSMVEVTGGEPLIQKETPELIHTLIQKNYTVLLETNGSISIKDINPQCVRILDIKSPSSGEGHSFLWENLTYISPGDEFKFVVGTRADYEFAREIITKKLKTHPPDHIHLSPVFETISPQRLAAWILEDNLKARLSLQQHKIIWHPDERGV